MKFKPLLSSFCQTTQHTGYRRACKTEAVNSVTVTRSPNKDCEFEHSATAFHDFYLCRQRQMKLRLVGWAANCQNSAVGTLTIQPLGINSGQDSGWMSGHRNLLIT